MDDAFSVLLLLLWEEEKDSGEEDEDGVVVDEEEGAPAENSTSNKGCWRLIECTSRVMMEGLEGRFKLRCDNSPALSQVAACGVEYPP
jgi:hypothetical protein